MLILASDPTHDENKGTMARAAVQQARHARRAPPDGGPCRPESLESRQHATRTLGGGERLRRRVGEERLRGGGDAPRRRGGLGERRVRRGGGGDSRWRGAPGLGRLRGGDGSLRHSPHLNKRTPGRAPNGMHSVPFSTTPTP